VYTLDSLPYPSGTLPYIGLLDIIGTGAWIRDYRNYSIAIITIVRSAIAIFVIGWLFIAKLLVDC
jgi:hypothetical protein